MYLQDWIRRWLIAALIGLLIIAGCGVGFFWNDDHRVQEEESRHVINRVRLQVNGMMRYLEHYGQKVANTPEIQEAIRSMAKEQGLNLIYTGLDGRVMFNTAPGDGIQQLDLRTDLHYDLYHARMDQDHYRIAFPVVDEATQVQVGHAVFTLQARDVLGPRTNVILYSLLAVMAFILTLLCLLLFLLRRKIRRDIIQPARQLKDYSEAILKGNYEQGTAYHRMDEMGEVHIMFEQMRLEIQHLSRRRDEQDQAQKELISNISHELKTPLATLKAYIEAIREGVCPDMDSVMEYAEVMHNNTEKMSRLTEDLLLHALQELGQISVTLRERYSKELLQSILQPIAHYVSTTGVHFVGPEEIPDVLIHVDGHRLEQVIANLIANALKHTSPGDTICVNMELARGQLTITIADTGRGILPQDMPFVFDRYFKGKADKDSEVEGSGLGLSICKYIIEAHRGTISFNSVQGQGTTFYCSLPL